MRERQPVASGFSRTEPVASGFSRTEPVASGFSQTELVASGASRTPNPAEAGFHEDSSPTSLGEDPSATSLGEGGQVRVVLPAHLQTLARASGEVTLEVAPPVTQRAVLDVLEARFPSLRGTMRDHVTRRRRPFIRFFACGEDLSNESPDAALPEAVTSGREPFLVIGAIAGG